MRISDWSSDVCSSDLNESRAAAADPVELVTMLYDELETAVGVLAAMVRQGQRISATEPAHRARAILIGLDVNLDRDKGGDVATALSRVYRSMRRKLDDAVAANRDRKSTRLNSSH